MSVHVYGTVQTITGEKLWESVRRLTGKYERDAEHPVSLDTLPPSVQKQMNSLVGFEIRIHKIEAAFKLSQNRNPEDFFNIIHQLRKMGTVNANLMADAMARVAKDRPD